MALGVGRLLKILKGYWVIYPARSKYIPIPTKYVVRIYPTYIRSLLKAVYNEYNFFMNGNLIYVTPSPPYSMRELS